MILTIHGESFARHEDAPITDHCRRSNLVAPTLAIRGFLRPERDLSRDFGCQGLGSVSWCRSIRFFATEEWRSLDVPILNGYSKDHELSRGAMISIFGVIFANSSVRSSIQFIYWRLGDSWSLGPWDGQSANQAAIPLANSGPRGLYWVLYLVVIIVGPGICNYCWGCSFTGSSKLSIFGLRDVDSMVDELWLMTIHDGLWWSSMVNHGSWWVSDLSDRN